MSGNNDKHEGQDSKNRRSDKVHIDKTVPIFQIGSFLLTLIIAAITMTNWADGEHAETNNQIAETNKQVAINAAVIISEKEAKQQDRKVTMRFYTSIENKVSSIEHIMIKRDERINNFMIEMAKKR